MNTLVIQTFWETVDKTRNLGTIDRPFYAVNHGDYVLKNTVFYADEKRDIKRLKADGRKRKHAFEFIPRGYKTKPVSHYGIKSFQTITIED